MHTGTVVEPLNTADVGMPPDPLPSRPLGAPVGTAVGFARDRREDPEPGHTEGKGNTVGNRYHFVTLGEFITPDCDACCIWMFDHKNERGLVSILTSSE